MQMVIADSPLAAGELPASPSLSKGITALKGGLLRQSTGEGGRICSNELETLIFYLRILQNSSHPLVQTRQNFSEHTVQIIPTLRSRLSIKIQGSLKLEMSICTLQM